MKFKALPVTSFEDVTVDLEQLQPLIRANGAFIAHASAAAQLGSAAAPAKVAINTIDQDVSGWFDVTNQRFRPQSPGFYRFVGYAISTAGLVSGDFTRLQVRKNGSLLTPASMGDASQQASTGFAVQAQSVADPVLMNGSTDFVELWGVCVTSGSTQVATTFNAVLSGSFIGPVT